MAGRALRATENSIRQDKQDSADYKDLMVNSLRVISQRPTQTDTDRMHDRLSAP